MLRTRQKFEDAAELSQRLNEMVDSNEIAYVYDSKGNQLERIEMREETLSDGSKVFNFHLS